MREFYGYAFIVKGNVAIIKIPHGDPMASLINALEYGAREVDLLFANHDAGNATVIQRLPVSEDKDHQLYAMTSRRYENELDAVAKSAGKRIYLPSLIQESSAFMPYPPDGKSEFH